MQSTLWRGYNAAGKVIGDLVAQNEGHAMTEFQAMFFEHEINPEVDDKVVRVQDTGIACK